MTYQTDDEQWHCDACDEEYDTEAEADMCSTYCQSGFMDDFGDK